MAKTKQQRYEARMRENGYKRVQLWVKEEHEQKIRDYAERCAEKTKIHDERGENGGSLSGVKNEDERGVENKGRTWTTSKKIFP